MSIVIVVLIQFISFVIIYFYVRHIKNSITKQEMAKIREELNLLLVELNQTTDRNITLIEDRINTLKKLVEEADKRIRVLNQEISRKTVESSVYNRLGKLKDDADVQIAITAKEASVNRDSAKGNSVGGETTVEMDAEEAIPFVKLSHQNVTKNEIKEKVISLHNKGLDKELIANKLGISLSEVELVIELYQ